MVEDDAWYAEGGQQPEADLAAFQRDGKGKGKGGNGKGGKGEGKDSWQKQPSVPCPVCARTGHAADKCWSSPTSKDFKGADYAKRANEYRDKEKGKAANNLEPAPAREAEAGSLEQDVEIGGGGMYFTDMAVPEFGEEEPEEREDWQSETEMTAAEERF